LSQIVYTFFGTGNGEFETELNDHPYVVHKRKKLKAYLNPRFKKNGRVSFFKCIHCVAIYNCFWEAIPFINNSK